MRMKVGKRGTHIFQVTGRRKGKNQFGDSKGKQGHSSGETQATIIAGHPFLTHTQRPACNDWHMQAQKPPVELEGRNAEKFVDYWQYGQRLVVRFNLKYSLVHRTIKTNRKHINPYLSSKH